MLHPNDKLYKPENPLDLKITGQANHADAIEYLPLQATVDFDVFGESVGALMMRRGKGTRMFTWGWEIQGTHVYDLAQNLIGLYDSIQEGLLNIPYYLTWDIHLGGEATSQDRVIQLTQLIEQNTNPEIDHLLISELARCQQLARDGIREPKFVRLYVTYKPRADKQGRKTEDKIASFGKELHGIYTELSDWISNKQTKKKLVAVEEQFRTAFLRGYRSTSTLLSGTFGLQVRPMSHDEIWTNLRHRFSGEEAGKSPNIVHCKIDERGVRLHSELTGQMHIVGHLLKDYPVKLDPEWAYTKRFDPESGTIQDRFTGVLRATGPFKALTHEFHQCRALWDLLAHESCKDTEFCIQLTPSDNRLARDAASELYRQSVRQFEERAKKREYDPGSDIRAQQAKEAMRALYTGDTPIRVCFVVLIHRKSLAQLDIACRDFISRCRWMELVREYVVSHRLWLQTLPCNDDSMGQYKVFGYDYARVQRTGAQFDRRIYYGPKQAITFFPFVRTLPNNDQGIEFIAPDKQPFWVDFFRSTMEKHWAIIAAHRSSKSALAAYIADHGLARTQPVTWLDYPPPQDDKSSKSSLQERSEYVDGTHIEIQSKSINIIQLADLRHLPPDLQKDRTQFSITYWIEVIMILAGPTDQGSQLYSTTKKIVEMSITTFLNDPQIQTRYGDAIRGGFGSEAWQKTPTLKDLARFITREKLESRLSSLGDNVQEALDLLQFNFSQITDTRTTIGRAISMPSTVKLDSLSTVFSLRNINEGPESLAYSLAAYVLAIQNSLSHEISHVIIDEAQNLALHEGVLRLIEKLSTTGGKSGIRLGLITNSFSKVAQSSAGASLLANLNTKFVGPIDGSSIEALEKDLGIPRDLLKKCSETNFVLSRKDGCSNWLIQDYKRHTFGRWYAPWESIVLSSSNSDERAIKGWFFANIPDKHEALTACTRYFRFHWSAGLGLKMPHSFDEVAPFLPEPSQSLTGAN